jgi:hypothetical protein
MPRIRSRELPEQVEKIGEVFEVGDTFCLKFRRIGEKNWESLKNQDRTVLDAQRHRWNASIVVGRTGKRIVPTELSDAQLRHAEMAFVSMRQRGWFRDDGDAANLVDLVNFAMVKQGPAKSQAPLLVDCIDTFLGVKEDRMKRGLLRKATFRELKRILRSGSDSLANTFADRRVTQVTAKEIETAIDARESETQRHKYRTVFNNFFEYASGKHNQTPWLDRNPVRNIAKIEVRQGEVSCYSYPEVIKLLKAATAEGQLAYFVFRLFTLARREETLRLIELGGSVVSENKFIGDRIVRFTSEMVKTKKEQRRGGRRVPIDPTLRLWLDYFAKNKIPLWSTPKRDARVRDAIAEKSGAGFANVLRHTSVTFHAKRYGNTDRTAQLAGHSILMLWDRYYSYDGITEADARKLYRLTPKEAKRIGVL